MAVGLKTHLSGMRSVPTVKQKRFIEAYAQHGNGARAVREAGYGSKTPASQSAVGYELLERPYIREELLALMEKSGLVLEKTMDAHAEVINQDRDLKSRMSAINSHYDILGMRGKRETSKTTKVINLFVDARKDKTA